MQSNSSAPETPIGDRKRPGVGLYFLLLAVQTSGVAVLVWHGVPLYRLMAMDFENYRPDPWPWWGVAAILLIQVAYWLRVRLRPRLPRPGHIVLAHIVAFIARIGFVAVTASFTIMFVNRFSDLQRINYSAFRAVLTLIGFFSIFCWTLEIERLSKAFQGNEA